MQMPAFSKRDHVAMFVIGTYLATSAMVATFFALGMRYEGRVAVGLTIATMLVPGLVSLGLTAGVLKQPLSVLALRPNFSPWYLLALLLPALASGLVVVAMPLLPGRLMFASSTAFSAIFQALPAGVSLGALFALGEELGWRGFLFHNIDEAPWRKSLTIGAIWGVWQMPLVLFGMNDVGSKPLSVLLTIALAVAWSPAFTVMRSRTRSVLSCAVMHGTINALAAIMSTLPMSGARWLTGPTGVSSVVAAALVSALAMLISSRIPVSVDES